MIPRNELEEKLTPLQQNIINLMGNDFSQVEIAKELGVSRRTVSRELKIARNVIRQLIYGSGGAFNLHNESVSLDPDFEEQGFHTE